MSNEASVKIGIEGADEVARAAERALRPWESHAESAKGAMRSFGGVVSDAIRQATSDIARGVTAFAALDFAGSIRSAVAFKQELGRLSVVSGVAAETMAKKFRDQESAILSTRQANEQFAKQLGRMTYDYKGAIDSVTSLGREAIASGRGLNEMAGFGRTVAQATGSLRGTDELLGRIAAQARALGTVGGPDALRDQFEGLSGAIESMAQRTPEAAAKLSAFVGVLGKGARPEVAGKAGAAVLGQIQSDPIGWERMLRSEGMLGRNERLIDEATGDFKDPVQAARLAQRAMIKRYGGRRRAREVAMRHFGTQAGARFMSMDFDEVDEVASMTGDARGKGAVDALRGTPAGRLLAAQVAKEGAAMDVGASTTGAASQVMQFASEHPVLAAGGAMMAPNMIAGGISRSLTSIGETLRGSLQTSAASVTAGGASAGASMRAGGVAAGASLTKASTGLLGKLGLVGAAGAAGWAVGRKIDEATGISDTIAGTSKTHRELRRIEDNVETEKMVKASRAKRRAQVHEAATGMIKRFKRAGSAEKFDEMWGDWSLRGAKETPALLPLYEGLHSGTVDAAGLSKESVSAIREAIESAGLKITIVNEGQAPVRAVEENSNTDQ